MDYFDTYVSNTCAGSGNQFYFTMDKSEKRTGRIFTKITNGGSYDYSLLFSNIIDSTFDDGSKSHKNLVCNSWQIHSASIGRCKEICYFQKTLTMSDFGGNADIEVGDFREITFNGKKEKDVMPGEFFATDPLRLNFKKDEYLCLELCFSGTMIPYHEESLLPLFVKNRDKWTYSPQIPPISMIGCKRSAGAKIAFWGDSITQGIGTELNSYMHWNSLLAQKLGDEFSYWNLGLGYGRANDAASLGAWFYKACQCDTIFVCFGVNDILKGQSEEQIKTDLETIVKALKSKGKKVILQTVPPFDYQGENIQKWNRINSYIKNELIYIADYVYDNNPVLRLNSQSPHMAKYGGHPNEEGCTLWAEDLYSKVKDII